MKYRAITPIRSYSWEVNINSKDFGYYISQIRLRHVILELRYCNETWMPWFIRKVRPRDPTCVAWYMHMDALCWYVSVSTTQRKSWWTHWVPLESLGFILCKSTGFDLVSRIQVQGDWIWSRWQVSVPAVNWPLDPSELSGLFIKTPCEILSWK
jgi:hypothetical protein